MNEEKRKEVRPVREKERRNERRSETGERKKKNSTVREMREVIKNYFFIRFELQCALIFESAL